MNSIKLSLLGVMALILLIGCSDDSTSPVQPQVDVSNAAKGNSPNFTAHLSGREEVPAVETLAQGQVILKLSKDGKELAFKLIVSTE
jgi:hypothetical protein